MTLKCVLKQSFMQGHLSKCLESTFQYIKCLTRRFSAQSVRISSTTNYGHQMAISWTFYLPFSLMSFTVVCWPGCPFLSVCAQSSSFGPVLCLSFRRHSLEFLFAAFLNYYSPLDLCFLVHNLNL